MNRRDLMTGLAAGVAWLSSAVHAFAQPNRKEVLAFYYGWYGTPGRADGYIHWQDPDSVKHTLKDAVEYPVGGPYDSLDPAIIARHVAQAAENGITGLVASWWGRENRTDQQLTALLDAAEPSQLKVCAYIEQARTPEDLADEILYIYQTHMRHSAWLIVDAKPAVFIFDRVLQTIGLDGWQKARARVEQTAPQAIAFVGTANTLKEIAARKPHFDVLHIYSMQFEAAEKRLYPPLWRETFYRDWVRAQSGLKATTATVLPGFDDSRLPDRLGKRPIVGRDGGLSYLRLWRAALKARPDWVLIVSFNEWHEASQIEPSVEFGERELATTKTMSARFMAP